MRLFSPGFPPDDVFAHPRHEAAQKALPDLIVQLRAAANVKDGYELQQELIGSSAGPRRPATPSARRSSGCRSVSRRSRTRRSRSPAGIPRSWRPGSSSAACASVVARQFRSVGDALAWRVFGFERRNIIALCQNDPPGVWAGKTGAAAELDAIEQAYRQDGQFAILHDMTNCLRIGDVTMFRNGGHLDRLAVDRPQPQRLALTTRAG